ncbi:MAG: hypothetical protein QNJ22_07545 [Desulfosarcinaceae bacterium]|nr:hypothetical protein [Desulfosarcinaceae bacterium]
MKVADLVASATAFQSIPSEALAEFDAKREILVARINERMLQRPDLDALVGAGNQQMMKDNHANHALFMSAVLGNYHAQVLVDTILWVFRAYRSRAFHPNYWAAQLNAWVDILKQELSPESAGAILPLYHWMIVHIPQFSQLTDGAAGGAITQKAAQ